ncbi:MAG: ATP:cob(I)alamin adenosyltransferase [Pyrinomonadaceae bacterium]
MSIATKHGDGGQTSLIGGARVSKGELRVEAYGTIDELNSIMGFARSICDDEEVNEFTKRIQRELFSVAGALATQTGVQKAKPDVTVEMVEALTTEVHRIESMEGILSDWSPRWRALCIVGL